MQRLLTKQKPNDFKPKDDGSLESAATPACVSVVQALNQHYEHGVCELRRLLHVSLPLAASRCVSLRLAASGLPVRPVGAAFRSSPYCVCGVQW